MSLRGGCAEASSNEGTLLRGTNKTAVRFHARLLLFGYVPSYTRYCFTDSGAVVTSSETVMVIFMLLAAAKAAHQLMKASP